MENLINILNLFTKVEVQDICIIKLCQNYILNMKSTELRASVSLTL